VKVDKKYCDDAKTLKIKMEKNIDARRILKLLVEYPERTWYRDPYYLNVKLRKFYDAVTNKPMDPKRLIPPPEKKRKGYVPPKIPPDWCPTSVELYKELN